MLKSLTLACCFMLVGAFAFGDIRDSATGADFPSQVSFDAAGKTFKLDATGVATRKKFFVNVYSVAHYLQEGVLLNGANKFEDLLNDDAAKQLTFIWARGVESAKVQDGYVESFKKSLSSSEYNQLQQEVDQFISFFKDDVRKGDMHEFKSLPGGTIEVIIKGAKVGSIANAAFAKGLWSIWFGDHSVVDRDKLISLIK